MLLIFGLRRRVSGYFLREAGLRDLIFWEGGVFRMTSVISLYGHMNI
jgi:hypothetical protein